MITPLLKDAQELELEGLRLLYGKINHHDIYLLKSGIGKVNAAITTYKIIRGCNPDLVINTGVAGGASSRTLIGDLLVADYVAYHDVWCGPGTQPGQADGLPVFIECDKDVIRLAYERLAATRLQVGLICSGDAFIDSGDEIKRIRSIFPEVVAVDMESAAIAHVCYMEKTKFNIVRIISDTPGEGENISQYQNFWEEAPEKTFETVKCILENIQ